ncbi:MAG TPA: small ribosomal subunit Rsm22 family protein [Bradyrhizobium sp.]|nr:small ribosomal subunit Rsm22 family protein [Bradyrhizobium sp.]
MISPSLPAPLKAALDGRLHGLSRNDAAARAAVISRTYRDGGGSGAIRTETDALAYALARMPATYAAVTACLNAFFELRPDFAPQSLLDIGAGPGTASFAAAEAFPSLQRLTLLDRNGALRALAMELARADPRLGKLDYGSGEARSVLAQSDAADLVVASYVIGELTETERDELVALAWSKTSDALLLVEPGTPAGYARIVAARAQLIANGARVAAPCPHDSACPLIAPDWCHFAQRLPRSRAHKAIKGAELPFEDEKFSYCIVTRAPVPSRPARVLAEPAVGKVEVSAKLCTPHGVRIAKVPRRDKTGYAVARRWRWGDGAVVEER